MKELAEYLTSERKKRNLTLANVAERSGVSANMLRGLEACDFQCLGASLLIRNTIRGYCKVLEIDPEPLLEKYSSQIETFQFQEKGLLKYARQMKMLRHKRRSFSFPLLVLTLATIGIMYGGAWVSEKRARMYAPPPIADHISTQQEDLPAELRQKLARNADKDSTEVRPGSGINLPGKLPARSGRTEADSREADKALREAEKNINDPDRPRSSGNIKAPAEPVKIASVPEAGVEEDRPAPDPGKRVALSNSTEVMAEERPAVSPDSRKGYCFSIEANNKTWVKVVIDDRETRSAMLHPGEKREWTAQKGVQVVIGNAGGVSMKWDDQQVKAPRDPGRVLRFRLPEQIASMND
ncbi:MAG: RodZ domain-containing protein [Syntrophobacter sp.]